ncbi:MAG: hypothetical protein ABI835_11655 [Chloroflexota bacterium]
MPRVNKKAQANFVLELVSLNSRDYPIARANVVGNQLIVDCCPLCGCTHFHGAGDPSDSRYPAYGHRVQHCLDANKNTTEGKIINKWHASHPESKQFYEQHSGYVVEREL